MSRIFVTGDIHGDPFERFSFHTFPESRKLTRDDYVIVVGDFGCVWDKVESKEESYKLDWLNDKPFTTFFIGGNHENWDRLRDLPLIDAYGAKLAQIRENIYFIPNATIMDMHGRKIFFFGGAMSTDRGGLELNTFYPEEGKSWWRSEIPSKEEMLKGVNLLESVGSKVDIIITHTMPINSVNAFIEENGYHQVRAMDPTANFLSYVENHTKFGKWFCGHFHKNSKFGNVNCLYKHIVDIDNCMNYNVQSAFTDGLYHPLW